MISRIRYINARQTVPYGNLAMEEYLLMQVAPGECILYLWQNKHTVVIGRNQNAWKECKVGELEANGGYLVRRLSGGGAVFHDLGNLNFTFLVHEEDYDVDRQLSVILGAVRKLGIDAEKSGRNDITAGGRKFSGNAFYSTDGRCYHHGTILVHVDMGNLSRFLNVSLDKLKSKGVDSVKSRVTNLTTLNPAVTIDMMRQKLIESFGEVYGLTASEIPDSEIDRAQIEALTGKFSSWEWKFGRRIAFVVELSHRFGWGDLQLQLSLNEGRVVQAQAYSDAMDVSFVRELPGVLEDCAFSSAALVEAVGTINAADDAVRAMRHDLQNYILQLNL